MDPNYNNSQENEMDIDEITEGILLKRLDSVFDQSNISKIKLKDEEIKEYVEFNRVYLKKIDEIMADIKKLMFLYVCEPEEIDFQDVNSIYEQPIKANVVLAKVFKIEYLKVSIINYGYGDPNKITDFYELELVTKKDKKLKYEISGTDLVRFHYQGSHIDQEGNILAVSVEKAMDALNKYYY